VAIRLKNTQGGREGAHLVRRLFLYVYHVSKVLSLVGNEKLRYGFEMLRWRVLVQIEQGEYCSL
jgi:hypothetical protein